MRFFWDFKENVPKRRWVLARSSYFLTLSLRKKMARCLLQGWQGMAHLKTLSIYFPACLRGKIMDLLFSPNIVLPFSNFLKFVLVLISNPPRLP